MKYRITIQNPWNGTTNNAFFPTLGEAEAFEQRQLEFLSRECVSFHGEHDLSLYI